MSNLPRVVLSLETYEERVALKQAQLELKQQDTINRMIELGFSQEDIDVMLDS